MKLYLNNFVLGEFNPLRAIVSAPLFSFSVGGYTIVVSNHMFMVTVATVILLIFLPIAVHPKRLLPKGFQNLIEFICVFLREQVARPLLGHSTDSFIYFVWTMFFLILTLNLLAMIPTEAIIYLITGKENHFGGPATANIWITGGLATITFILTHATGIKKQGLRQYFANFAPHVHWTIMPFIYFLEIISSLIRPIALAIRLFANIVAGHTLLATILGLILVFQNYYVAAVSITIAVAMSIMELFVAFLQAYIFTLLSTLFISFSVSQEH